jgi:hypothetical protein
LDLPPDSDFFLFRALFPSKTIVECWQTAVDVGIATTGKGWRFGALLDVVFSFFRSCEQLPTSWTLLAHDRLIVIILPLQSDSDRLPFNHISVVKH